VLRGGLAGLAVGLLLLAVAVFFLVSGFDEPDEVFGVFVPVSVAMLALSLAAMALVPLRLGDTPDRSPRVIARLLRGLAVLGVVVSALAAVRGELPYAAGVAIPVLVAAVLLVSAGRFSRVAARRP
jgi:hypothetical protein